MISRQITDLASAFAVEAEQDELPRLRQIDRTRDATRAKKVAVLDDIAGTCLDKGDEIDALGKLLEGEQRKLATAARAGEKVAVFRIHLVGLRLSLLVIAVLTTACNFANAQDRGIVQNWNSDYTAREWLVDCDQKRDQCYFLTRTVAQASFWFDKCIPDGTSIAEIAGVMMTFIERNPQYVDSPATNVLLTALHERWKCPR